MANFFRKLFNRHEETPETNYETTPEPVAEPMQAAPNADDPDAIIRKLGTALVREGEDAMTTLAAELAGKLSAQDVTYLRARLHAPPAAPKELEKELALGEWMAVCQYAIFELTYHMEPLPLEFIRSFAFGVYDWTQATALMILTRLSVEGKIADIIPEIDQKIGAMRDETQLYYGRALLLRGKKDERYFTIAASFTSPEFQQALEELSAGNGAA